MHWQNASSKIIIRRQKILNMRKFSQIIQTVILIISDTIDSTKSIECASKNSRK